MTRRSPSFTSPSPQPCPSCSHQSCSILVGTSVPLDCGDLPSLWVLKSNPVISSSEIKRGKNISEQQETFQETWTLSLHPCCCGCSVWQDRSLRRGGGGARGMSWQPPSFPRVHREFFMAFSQKGKSGRGGGGGDICWAPPTPQSTCRSLSRLLVSSSALPGGT